MQAAYVMIEDVALAAVPAIATWDFLNIFIFIINYISCSSLIYFSSHRQNNHREETPIDVGLTVKPIWSELKLSLFCCGNNRVTMKKRLTAQHCKVTDKFLQILLQEITSGTVYSQFFGFVLPGFSTDMRSCRFCFKKWSPAGFWSGCAVVMVIALALWVPVYRKLRVRGIWEGFGTVWSP